MIASGNAYFEDSVVLMGIPGVEYFAYPYDMDARRVKACRRRARSRSGW